MINKCNEYFCLLSYKPTLLYRKKSIYTNTLSFWINIIYMIVLITFALCFIIQYIHESIKSIYSYYTPLPSTMNISIEVSLIDFESNQAIKKLERYIKLSLVESLISSNIIYMASSDMNEQNKTKLYRPIGNDYTYIIDMSIFRNETYLNTMTLEIELCKEDDDIRCESKKNIEDLLSKSLLKVKFPTCYYDPLEYRTKTIEKNFQFKLLFDETKLYILTLEPQEVLEDCRFCYFTSQISKFVMKNNYDIINIQDFPLKDNSKYKLHLVMSNYKNNIVIKYINVFKDTMPVVTATFYIVNKIFNVIFNYSMRWYYKSDFENDLQNKQTSFNKKNTTMSSIMNKQKNLSSKPLNQNMGNSLLNCSPITYNHNNESFNQLVHQKRKSEIGMQNNNQKKKTCKTIFNNNTPLFAYNPKTMVRVYQNIPPTFSENQQSSAINILENNVVQANKDIIFIKDHTKIVQQQPLSLHFNISQHNSKINPSNKYTTADKNKTFSSMICCCCKVSLKSSEFKQKLRLQKKIKKFASIDEIVFQLSCFEKLFIKLLESKKIDEALCDDDHNNQSYGL